MEDVDHSRLKINVVPQLSQEGYRALLNPISKEEVHRAVMGMGSFKAPSLDGFPAYFF